MAHSSGIGQSEPTRLELIGAKTGNCLRAAIGLSEAGLSYRIRHIDLWRSEQGSPAHLALNPAGQVPVLILHPAPGSPGFVLTQSSAILFYADELAPTRLLPPPGSPMRVKALEAYFYFTSDVIAANGAAFALNSEGFVAAANVLSERSLTLLTNSERFLSNAGYMGGDCFSVADIAGFTIATAVAAQLPWDRLPRLDAWRARIARRPALQQGMAAFNR